MRNLKGIEAKIKTGRDHLSKVFLYETTIWCGFKEGLRQHF